MKLPRPMTRGLWTAACIVVVEPAAHIRGQAHVVARSVCLVFQHVNELLFAIHKGGRCKRSTGWRTLGSLRDLAFWTGRYRSSATSVSCTPGISCVSFNLGTAIAYHSANSRQRPRRADTKQGHHRRKGEMRFITRAPRHGRKRGEDVRSRRFLLGLAFAAAACGPAKESPRFAAASPAGSLSSGLLEWRGQPQHISLGGERFGSIVNLKGTMLLAGPAGPASDSRPR